MFLGKRINELREQQVIFTHPLASKMEIDTLMYSNIEQEERKTKREQAIELAKLYLYR